MRPMVTTATILLGASTLAACGSGGKSSTSGGSRNYRAFLNFSNCMRVHGVPNFPDAPAGGGIHITPGDGLNPQAPAFQAARQTCNKLLPGGGPSRVVPESVKVQLVDHAECMRAHGVPNYPDPIFPSGGGIETIVPSSIAPGAPAFQTAAKACGGP
jgi:hypothetical protein